MEGSNSQPNQQIFRVIKETDDQIYIDNQKSRWSKTSRMGNFENTLDTITSYIQFINIELEISTKESKKTKFFDDNLIEEIKL